MENLGNSEGVSEVARIRSLIIAELDAANLALYGPASVAKHDFINQKYANIGAYADELGKHVGEDAALEMVVEINNEHIGRRDLAGQQIGPVAVENGIEGEGL